MVVMLAGTVIREDKRVLVLCVTGATANNATDSMKNAFTPRPWLS
jgi:hypothetical protein